MKNSKGFSLIELIIVIAILAILSTGAVAGLSKIRYANTKKCANELNTLIEKGRMQAMSKAGTWYLYVYKTSDGVYYKITKETTTPTDGNLLAGNSISIKFQKDGASSEETLTAGSNPIKLKFSKNTGGLLEESVTGGAAYYKYIKVIGSSTYKIELNKLTGKHFLSKG
ncbi:prepilin-type N-terminal cleavage/methylation domain-containing protein [Anaeromicropila populeti]|uniref:Prepilin-type N-terminal cleavage/methylation domain-containing protein n=1 Tax=Anaeromicropila populeti TaxID=37658 RepID=A0A1I6INX7_9FIRM|nr:prepilin-type N-terminal cleavage/methylation domain-containing protein [Anaeromicropila populeti]SFR68426.1 prepilin-type N-terminal cleavage/methylation domain-containing protein [Anaeromicropila populeti]